ncbi:ribulose-phosphate 3-epimerase [Abyssisolibacter fermentans]|uniref:ribulose-phosphate 3-epimerase n=1 Tax=Abyssisolibacter fermentans TaxID=1766203 RepID=UPI000830834E|nr:ribulose-phosphate 3-epimerase [Abyssisolibacter fermentans]
MIKISPSILSADFSNIREDIKKVEDAGVDLLHIDVMDGAFVPNITFGQVVIKDFRKISKIPFDVHLMIEKPERFIEDFVKAGADIITVHYESTVHVHRAIQLIKSFGIKAGIALNPATPIECVKHLLNDVDMVLIMTVNPGFGGQKFIEATKDKIKQLRTLIDERDLDIDIEVDGGIKEDNIAEVFKCGANVFVAGSAVFNSKDINLTIKNFRRLTEF